MKRARWLLSGPLGAMVIALVLTALAMVVAGASPIDGFAALFGGALALLFSLSRIVELSFFPYAVILQVTPIVAIAPLIIIWVHTPFLALLVCAWIVAFFPIVSNTTVGLNSADRNLLALFRLYGASRWQALRSVTVVPFTETQKRLRDAGPGELAVVLYRRMMMRIADAVADRMEASALVTGENLGQVASQTVENLTTIEDAARHLVLRPLLTYDKVETTALARRIGTYETSILPFDDCCSLFVPAHPATRARVEDAAKAEAKLDLPAEVAAAVAASEHVPIT